MLPTLATPDRQECRPANGASPQGLPGARSGRAWLLLAGEMLVWLSFLGLAMGCGLRWQESESLTKEIYPALGLLAAFFLPLALVRVLAAIGPVSPPPWPVAAYLPLGVGGLLAAWIGIDDFHHRRMVGWVALGSCALFTAVLLTELRSWNSAANAWRPWRWLALPVVIATWWAAVVLHQASLRPPNALPWRQTVVEGVIIHHAPDQPLDPRLIREFPRLLQGVDAWWQHHVTRPKPLQIYLYPDGESLNATAEVLGSEDVSGMFDTNGTDAILMSVGPWAEMGSTLVHEYCHALNHARYHELPSFLDEGMAHCTERSLARQLGRPPEEPEALSTAPLAELFGESTFYETDPYYDFAGGFVAALVARHGVVTFHRFCERVTAFSTPAREFPAIQEAFRATYGGSLEAFVAQWRHGFPPEPKPSRRIRGGHHPQGRSRPLNGVPAPGGIPRIPRGLLSRHDDFAESRGPSGHRRAHRPG